jgi:hypothetical protein
MLLLNFFNPVYQHSRVEHLYLLRMGCGKVQILAAGTNSVQASGCS